MTKELKNKIRSLETYKDIKQTNLDNKAVILSESRKMLDAEVKNLDNLKQYYQELTLEKTTENTFLFHQIKNSLIISAHDNIVKSQLKLAALNLCFADALSAWRQAFSEFKAIESVIESKTSEINFLEDKKEAAENDEIGQILFGLRKYDQAGNSV
ncbi:flagellar export protein FliJ [Photobacterium kishitanii]|uniref:flagellar export protein FliJ n=1 Tax=Photobacterium kishitanii TaxID=318456 RepID=UPI0015E716BA|nr:flagellar FliJ family protein [Photobacterium kishitanii]